MAKTSVNCPQCRQPIVVELTRLFDMTTDPEAKQKLLSGSANFFQCPFCKFQGVYPTPIVYHDPDKELLLTYFPPEANTPLPQQEQILGPLIKKAVDSLPAEKRKGYLFRPQSMLTQQRLFERILEGDGVTPEMLKAQQEKLNFIQQLAKAKPENLPDLIKQNDTKVDEELFMLLSRLAQASAGNGDEQGARLLMALQQALIQHSSFGQKAANEAAATKAAIQALQDLSKAGLTRENLLDLLIQSQESEIRLTTIATMARGGLDYQFFQVLSDRIDAAGEADKNALAALRERLLEITAAVDAALKAQTIEAQKLLDELLSSDKIEEATLAALPKMNQVFGDVLNHAAHEADAAKDENKLKKLAAIVNIIQSESQSGAYMELVEMLLQAPDETARLALLEQAGDAINPDFMQMLSGLMGQLEQVGNQAEVLERIKVINREALRFSMQRNLRAENQA